MSQLRAKQIKLASAGDIIVGGVGGNGSVLAKGGNKQFLRVKADGSTLEYADLIAGDVAFDAGSTGLTSTTVNAAIAEVKGLLDGSEGRIDDLNTALGITGDDYTAITGSNYLNATTSFRGADLALDSAIKAVADSVSNLGAAFNYVGTVAGGATAGAAFDLATLSEKDAGDYYKVATAGYFVIDEGTAFYANLNDGLVWNTTAGVDIIDNTNSTVAGTTDRVSVTGSTDTGFIVDIASTYVGQTSITTLGTIGTGTWQGDVVATTYGGTGLSTVGDDNQVLTASGGSLAYAYVGALRTAAGAAVVEAGAFDTNKLVVSSTAGEVRLGASGATNADIVLAPAGTGKVIIGDTGAAVVESDTNQNLTLKANGTGVLTLGGTKVLAEAGYVPTDALSFVTKSYVDTAIDGVTVAEQTDELVAVGAETTMTLTHTPTAGTVKVYFNGVKLRPVTHYTVSGTTVTLLPVAIGYAVEAGDVLEAVYNYNAA